MTTRKEALIALRDAAKGDWRASGDGDDSWLLIHDAGLKQHSAWIYEAWVKNSLDAALALHEAVLSKGEGWEIYRTGKYPGMIPGSSPFAYAASVGYGQTHKADAGTPARAWLLAILEALIAEEE